MIEGLDPRTAESIQTMHSYMFSRGEILFDQKVKLSAYLQYQCQLLNLGMCRTQCAFTQCYRHPNPPSSSIA